MADAATRARRLRARLARAMVARMNKLLSAAGIVGFCGVALGAFGAHGLEDRLSTEARGWWDTATAYALPHAAAALAIAFSRAPPRLARIGGWAFLFGALIFCGSLYALALGAPRILGAVAPIGGLAFLLGWALLVVAGARHRRLSPDGPGGR